MNFQNTETQFLFRLNPLDIIDGKLQEIQTKASLNLDQVMEIFYEISSVQLRPGRYMWYSNKKPLLSLSWSVSPF